MQPVPLEKLGPLVGPCGRGERPTLSEPSRAEQHGCGQSFVAMPLVDTHVRDIKALFGRYEISGGVPLAATVLPGFQNPLLIAGLGRGTIKPDLVSPRRTPFALPGMAFNSSAIGDIELGMPHDITRDGRAPADGPTENPASKSPPKYHLLRTKTVAHLVGPSPSKVERREQSPCRPRHQIPIAYISNDLCKSCVRAGRCSDCIFARCRLAKCTIRHRRNNKGYAHYLKHRKLPTSAAYLPWTPYNFSPDDRISSNGCLPCL